jgi:Arc/MetJ family transcription regulator
MGRGKAYNRDREESMSTSGKRSHKHFRLDAAKITRAQKALGTATETETIERALDLVISEARRNRLIAEAHEEFVRSGARIEDVYGVLESQ